MKIGSEPGTGTPKVTFPIGDFTSRMTPTAACQLADALNNQNRGKLQIPSVLDNPYVIGWDKLSISGRGAALVLTSVKSGESITMSHSIAKDMARQLRKAADVVEEQLRQLQQKREAEPRVIDADTIFKKPR